MYKLITIVTLIVSITSMSLSVQGQDMQPPTSAAPPAANYSQAQLDQMLAPIALYPDTLLGQVLMASTYPLEIVEADRWLQSQQNSNLSGDQLAAALQQQPWDPSVKALTAVPAVLKMLNTNLQWTEQLGDAFLAQQDAVMNSVQQLRQQAQSSGALASGPQQVVSEQGPDIVIAQANPDVVYVPVYNPNVVYGIWGYPGYPPYAFYPSGYGYGYGSYGWNRAYIGFGTGFAVGGLIWGWDHWDWDHYRIGIDANRFAYLNRGQPPYAGGYWQHNPIHRQGVPYRDAGTRARFQNGASPAQQRGFRGYNAAPNPRPTSSFADHANGHPDFAAHANGGPSYAGHGNAGPADTGHTHDAPVYGAHGSAGGANIGHENQAPTYAAHTPAYHNAPAATPNFNHGAEAPVAQHQAVAPSFQQRVAAPARPATPIFESFSQENNIHAQSARGAASRATAPAPAAYHAPQPAPASNHASQPAPAANHGGGGGGGNRDGGNDQRH